jgi:cytoskeletal protein CcmA (bactofilin family)
MKPYGYPCMLGVLMALALLLVWAPRPAFAAQILQGDTVAVAIDQTIDDDVYSFGSTITIDGTVRGDVVAIGGTVIVNGTVAGNVDAAVGTITISGRVDGSVRAVGGDITIDGRIGKDALIAGNTVNLTAKARIDRDLNVAARTATLNGKVGRNVSANVQTLHVGNTAGVHGSLTYGSETASIAPGALLQGPVKHAHFDAHWPGTWQVWTTGVWPAAVAFAWLRGFFSLAVLGLVFLLLAPSLGRRTVATIDRRPWASLGLGLAVLITVPLAAAVTFVIGVFIGGWWLALLALAIYVLAIALSLPITGYFVGQWLLQRAGTREVWPGASLILGLALLMLASLVPYLGGLVVLAAVLFGLGTLALSLHGAGGRESPDRRDGTVSGLDLRPVPSMDEARPPVDAARV